ncbi:MAG: diguanylate cyclase [Peptococcaceae bacterium]|nr:diguanylate cyclase [Peptococcaceae bacterium]
MNTQSILWGLYIMAATGYGLLVFFLTFSRRDRIIKIVIAMFVLHGLWVLSTFFMRAGFDPGAIFWNRVMVAVLVLLPLVVHFFLTSFSGVSHRVLTRLALGGVAVCLVLNFAGFVILHPVVYEVNQEINGLEAAVKMFDSHLGWGAGFLLLYMVLLLVSSFVVSLKGLRDNTLAGGIKLVFVGNAAFLTCFILNCVFWGGRYPIDMIAGLFNAVCVIVAVSKYRVLEFKFIFKKGGVLLFFIEVIAIVYVYAAIKVEALLRANDYSDSLYYIMPVMIILALLIFNAGFSKFNQNIDKMFMATEYQQRQWLRDFSVSLASKLGLDEITQTFIEAVKNVLRVRDVYLALYDEEKREYAINSRAFSEGALVNGQKYAFAEDHPILTWLHQNNTCLKREEIEKQPVFKALWEAEWELINDIDLELVAPLQSRSRMIGMLILAKKQDESAFTMEDLDLLLSLGGSTAVALDNAFSYERAKNEANTDSLTGLYNHRYFYRVLRKLIDEAEESPLSLVLLDLDMFKLYNDMYGHLEGDKALETVAEILTERVAKQGVVARYGGEEFVILLPRHDAKQTEALTENIRQEVQRMFSGGTGAENRFLSISAGICTYPAAAPSGEELLRRADIALYSAKNSGKNRIVVYGPSLALPQKQEEEEEIFWLTVPGNELVSHASTIFALTATIETKDYYTYGHSQKVAQYASALAAAIGLDDWHIKSIKEAALLHDIGKIGIPEEILKKVGRLNEEELEVMRRHVDMSVTIIKHLPTLQYVLPAVIGHHEFWDGAGYPRGICGEDIPISARCLSIADSFDAMMSTRPYRTACSLDYALHEIREKAGSQFDPHLADAFIVLAQSGSIDVTPYGQ